MTDARLEAEERLLKVQLESLLRPDAHSGLRDRTAQQGHADLPTVSRGPWRQGRDIGLVAASFLVGAVLLWSPWDAGAGDSRSSASGGDPRQESDVVQDSPVDLEPVTSRSQLRAVPPDTRALRLFRLSDDAMRDLTRLQKLEILRCEDCRLTDAALGRIAADHPGLLELTVSGNDAVTSAGVRRLGALKELRTLDISFCEGVGGDAWETILGLRRLTCLDVSHTGIPEQKLRSIPSLKMLGSLDGSGLQVSDATIEQLARLPSLVELKLSTSQVSDAGLATLARMKGLRRLDLSFSYRITDEGLRQVARMTWLQELNLNGCRISAQGFGLLKRLTRLRALHLGGRLVNDAFTATIGRMRKLERLELSSASLTDAGLKALASLRELRTLQLTYAKSLTGKGVASISRLASLEELDLSVAVALVDRDLASLTRLSNLRDLQLHRIPALTDVTVDLFLKLPALEKLGIWETAISAAAVRRLQAARPKLKIEH